MIRELSLSRFRNHQATALSGAARFNLLTGPNGAGKTNLLEALSMLAPGRGLRGAAVAEMAADGGAHPFAITALLGPDDAPLRLGTGTREGEPARRIVRINGAAQPAIALSEWLAIVWLTPAMDRLFTASPGERRRFLDRLVIALAPGHALQVSRYEAALRERNRLLSAEAMPDPQWFDALEARLAEHGNAVRSARISAVQQIAAAAAAAPDGLFARPLIRYQSDGADDLLALWRAARARDRAAGRTLDGPHRDELIVHHAGHGAPAAQCSTGEQKALLIAIILAHAGLMQRANAAGQRPLLLLLDELAAHLDPARRAVLFAKLADLDAQIWLTGTEAAPFSALPEGYAHWEISGGQAEKRQ